MTADDFASRIACGRCLTIVVAIGLSSWSFALVAKAQTTIPADDRLPTTTIRTVQVQETTYRQEYSTEMVETPVRRWVPVPSQATVMQTPAYPHPRSGLAPWLANVPTVEWRLVEDKVRTPVTTSRIVPETRTVQKEVRMLAFEPGARALAQQTPLQPIPGAAALAATTPPRVATTAPIGTAPTFATPGVPAATFSTPTYSRPASSYGGSPAGGSNGFPTGPFDAAPSITPLQPTPAPAPFTATRPVPNVAWGGLQRIDGDLPAQGLGAASGRRY